MALRTSLMVADDGSRVRSGIGRLSHAGGTVAVQVFTANRDADDQVTQPLAAVLSNGSLESSELVVEDGLAGGGPETEKQAGLGSKGCFNGLGGRVGQCLPGSW